MKRILFVVIIALLFAACESSTKHLERGDYDAAK